MATASAGTYSLAVYSENVCSIAYKSVNQPRLVLGFKRTTLPITHMKTSWVILKLKILTYSLWHHLKALKGFTVDYQQYCE